MIIRELAQGQLLCINQTSHAHTAAEFCRFWGNATFERPQPNAEIMLGISQHDNGWFEWEQAPLLRSDGVPMDFLHLSEQTLEKLSLWRRGAERAYAQHPYAGLLTWRHAALLYQEFPDPFFAGPGQEHLERFLADERALLEITRQRFAGDPYWEEALSDERIEANTRLLKFGDRASLQVCMAAAGHRVLARCPQQRNALIDMEMVFDEKMVSFRPWPFCVDAFEVSVFGRVLNQRVFASVEEYHNALAEAPYREFRWLVCTTERNPA